MTDNELSKCIDSLLEDSTSDLGDLSLSVHLSNLSIDNSPNPSDNDQSSSFNLPSNLSKNLSNLSISYSISFEESPSPKPYSINTKRKRPSLLSVDSPQTGYSPLATSLLTSSNKKCPDKRRMSEFFKSEISVLNFSNKLGGSIDSLSDKDISFNRDLSVDSNKENLSDLSIDLNPNLSTKTTKSARFSERFRNEVSQLNLSSPDISFDLRGSGSPSPNVSLSFSDDEDGLNTCNKSCKGNVLKSSSDEDELSFDKENFKNMRLSRSLSEEDPDEQDEDDEQYDSSFIDDEAIEGSEESVSEEEEEAEASLLDLSDDDDEYVTPPSRNTETETPFYTPRSTKRNDAIFKTPSEFCHTPPVPTPSDR